MNAAGIDSFLLILGRSSLEAGVLVVLVLAGQWIFRKQLAPRWRCALWLLVVARLLLPFSVGSVTSIFNLMPNWTQRVASSLAEKVPVTLASASGATLSPLPAKRVDTPVAENRASVGLPDSTPPASTGPLAPAPEANEYVWSWPVCFFGAWLAGVFFMAGYVVISSFRLWRHCARLQPLAQPMALAVLKESCEQLKIKRTQLSLVESAAINSPALHGLFHPRLLVPKGFTEKFSPAELRFVFLHELAHLKRHDLLLNWLMAGLQVVHWFNPLVWLGFARWRADRELACDAMALAVAGEGHNKEYGRTILRLLENLVGPISTPGLVGILEDKRQLRRRIGMIASYVPARGWPRLALLLIGLLAVVGLTDAQNHTDNPNVSNDKSADTATNAASYLQPTGRTMRPVVANGPEMKVTVLDAKTGKPLSNAEVLAPNEAAFFNGSENAPHWFTDTNGMAVIHLGEVPADHLQQRSWFTLSVRHKGYAPRGFSWSAENKAVRPTMPREMTIRLEHGITAGGFVLDERGAPLEGIRVRIFGSDYWEGLRQEYSEFWSDSAGAPPIVTDAAGHWQVLDFPRDLNIVRIQFIRPDGSVQRFVQEGETDPREQGQAFNLAELKSNQAVFILSSGIDVRGVVVDPRGNPLPGVLIKTGYGMVNTIQAGEVRSDAAGRFDFPHRTSGQLILTADANGFALTSIVVNVGTDLSEVRLQVAPTNPLRIQVQDGRGRPIIGAKVSVYPMHSEGQMLNFEGITDAQGMLVWTNAPISDFALLATSPSGKVYQEILVTPKDRLPIFKLRPGMNNEILIRGQAHDARTGKPVKLESVSYETGDQEGFQWQAEILSSRFELAIPQTRFRPEGMYPVFQLKLEATGYRTLYTAWRDFAQGDWRPNFALEPADKGSVTVLQPDGSPAGGARVYIPKDPIGGTLICQAPNRYWGAHMIKVQADDKGHFTLPEIPGNQPVLLTHPDGFLKTSYGEVERLHQVHLQPWSRVEGILKISGKPKGGVRVGIDDLLNPTTSGFQLGYQTSTAPDGSFSFSNVPAGEYKLYRILSARIGPITEDHPQPITVKAGKALKVEYSNVGREVFGQAIPDNSSLAVDWLNDDQTLTLQQKELQLQRPNVQDYATTKAFYAAMNAFYDSPKRREQALHARTYVLTFQPDGSFRAEDIPPGTYELRIRLTKPDKNGRFSFYPNPKDKLGSLTRQVAVPPGRAPYDLGTLVVHLNGNATKKRPGPVHLTARTLDGQPLNLAEFKGKYVLLAFWASWSDRSTEELANLQKLHAEMSRDQRITFWGVNVGGNLKTVRETVKERGYDWDQAWLEGANLTKAEATFDIKSLPSICLVDPDGRIIQRNLAGDQVRVAVQRSLRASSTQEAK